MANQLKILWVGCGDIGARFSRQCSGQAWDITAVRRSASRLPEGVNGIVGDICDSQSLRRVLNACQPDVVVVTLTPAAMSDEGYRDSYVKGARTLCDELARNKIDPLILWVSSTAVYGQNHGEWVNEDSPAEPQSYRGRRLLEAEQIVLNACRQASVVRFSGIYGPGRERLINNVRSGNIASEKEPLWGNRIHSDDCAGVLQHLIERFSRGEPLDSCYLGTDSEPAVAHLMQRELAAILSGHSLSGGEISAPEGEVIKGRRCSNRRLLDSGYTLRYPSWQEGYQSVLATSKPG